MPAGKGGGTDERRGSNSAKRETFRPPWVKDGADGLPPKPSNLWSKTRQTSKDGPAPETAAAPKKSTVKVSQSQPQENGTTKENTFVRPQLKPVPPKEPTKLQSKEVKVPVKLNSVDRHRDSVPELKKPPLHRTSTLTADDKNIEKAIPTERNAIIRQESMKKMIGSKAPEAPPMPPPAPAFPRQTDLKPLSDKQKNLIESLKSRPKVRPDWTSLLKEVESGRKLKHVQCNDRSKPLLPQAKDGDKLIYESEKSEKDTSHNLLLKEIQQGVALRKTKTNDRSRPILEGLRKFRRQMTIEEQIIKSQSMASIPPEEIADEADELDDIDKVRDDLQSTKQMLALELRNKEALARDNKRLQTRVGQLEAEIDKERANKKVTSTAEPTEADEKLLKSLKSEAADARKIAQDLEKKFHDAASLLDNTKSELEEVRKQKLLLEKRLQDSTMGGKRLSLSDRKDSVRKESESEEEEEITESDSGESDNEEKRERRAQREIKQLRNKLRSFKNKEDNAKKERMALKTQIKRLQQAMKDEKKKYKGLKKEVSKMEALMKEVGDDSEEDEEEKEEKEEESETESESESETESSETDSDSEKSVSEAEDAPVDKKKTNLGKRTKKHEGRLTALKKGNYLLKTNVERLQDDLNKQKEESITLQQDLDSVLAELG